MADDRDSDGAAFYLAPSLLQAMQYMPDAFPEVAPTSDTTTELSNLHDNIVGRKDRLPDRSMHNKQVSNTSSDNSATPGDSGHASAEEVSCLREDVRRVNDGIIELRNSLELRILLTIDVLASMAKQDHKFGELDKSITELHQKLIDLKTALAEARERLKKKDIYTKSLEEYVDELEAKIDLLENSHASSPAEQAQAGKQTEFATISNAVQQTGTQQNAPTGDAVYRWQTYMIKRLEKENETLTEKYGFLKQNEEKYFKEAMHFERKLNNNVRNMREHMQLCHESKSFLNSEMTGNLIKIRAICEEQSEFVYGAEAAEESLSAVVSPESTWIQLETQVQTLKRGCTARLVVKQTENRNMRRRERSRNTLRALQEALIG